MSKQTKIKCCVCGAETQVLHIGTREPEELNFNYPEIFTCDECRENARQMLGIKKFAKEVNVKIDFGIRSKAEIHEVINSFNLMEETEDGL